MPLYRLKAGQVHYLRTGKRAGLKKLEGGAELTLTKAQGHAIRDKVELISETDDEKEVRETIEDSPSTENELDSRIVKREDDLGYDVMNEDTSEPMNDVPLELDEAIELIAQGG